MSLCSAARGRCRINICLGVDENLRDLGMATLQGVTQGSHASPVATVAIFHVELRFGSDEQLHDFTMVSFSCKVQWSFFIDIKEIDGRLLCDKHAYDFVLPCGSGMM